MADYDWKQRSQIAFTDEDIALATAGLSFDEAHKTIAHLDVDKGVSGYAVQLFGRLAETLKGRIKPGYNGLDIVVPKDETETRDAAMYALRYNSAHSALRKQRADESGIFVIEED